MSKTVVHMIGNAHIDPVWLWPWQAGADEALATFRSAADRCDEYPEFIFTRGEAWLYRWVEKLDPVLFARVERLVSEGRWHVTGGMVVQPDANLPTEEGWHRQFLHGLRYFRERLGVTPTVAYNVDTFGHPGTLPDLFASHGMTAFVFHRPSAAQLALPGATFRWRGSGGAEVLAFRIPSAYTTRSDDLYGQITLALEAADPNIGHTMCFYGVGNHGGGPTKGNIEYILSHRHAFEGAELRFSTPQAFFEAVAPYQDALPLVETELQHTFPGCYSVMHDIKQAQVRGEHRLVQVGHLLNAFEKDEGRRLAGHGRLDAAWEDLLLTQFHDILSGTSVPSAWSSVRALQGRAQIIAEEVALETTRCWARDTVPNVNHQQMILVNSNDEGFEGLIEHEPFLDFDAWGNRWLSTPDGISVPFQLVQPEGAIEISNRVLFKSTVPAKGWTTILVRDDGATPPSTPRSVRADPTVLGNDLVELELSPIGIAALRFHGHNLLGHGGATLHLRADSTDTWTFHHDRFTEDVTATLEGAWVVEENGPLRARVRLDTTLGTSRIRWTLSVEEGQPGFTMRLDVLFAERLRMLQLAFDLADAPSEWTDGQAGGSARRMPGETEWPVQGWSRVTTNGVPIALMTPDVYSLSLNGAHWQWTLLRSPKMAWSGNRPDVYAGRDDFTDQGAHTFEFDMRLGVSTLDELAKRVQLLARPLVKFDRYDGMNRPPWGNSPPRRLWTSAELRARQDGRMTHLIDDGTAAFEEPTDH